MMRKAVMKERLDTVVKKLGLSGRAFEKECGLADGSYSSIGNRVGADKLKKILFRFPQISAEWLLVGQGSMFKNEPSNEENGMNFEREVYNKEFDSLLLNHTDMKNILSSLTEIISCQQHDISRLISELERHGKRSDRMLNLIEYQRGIAYNRDDSEKKTKAK